MIKVVADQVGDHVNAEQDFDSGFLDSSYTTTRATTSVIKTELVGNTTYTYGDVTNIVSQTNMSMGFTAQN